MICRVNRGFLLVTIMMSAASVRCAVSDVHASTVPAAAVLCQQSTRTDDMSDIERKGGGTLIFPVANEAPTLNPYLSQTGWETLITQTIYEGLAAVGPDGQFHPVLAEELPTLENGGVSADGLIITWRLRRNVVWSDGEPFIAQDVRFTWEAVTDPQSQAVWAPGADLIEWIETPDEYTVVIKYSRPYPDYLGQFSSTSTAGQGILPKHATGEPSQMSEWESNRNPVGTGPFMLAEWKTGQYIRLVRNPLCWLEGKPFLDAILFPVVPNAEVHRQMMMRGDADVWFEFDQQYIRDLSAVSHIRINPGSQQWLLRLFFNLSKRGAKDPGEPHPILAERRVRKAIQLTIDRNLINEGAYGGRGKPMGHELYHGVFASPDPNLVYDPTAAKALLEEAGWVDLDGDAIRECQNCTHGDEGREMHLTLMAVSGSEPITLAQQLIVDMLSDVGIEVDPRREESSVLNSLALDGDFDLLMWEDGYEPVYDPGGFLKLYYWSQSIPPTSWNIMRFRNQEVDSLLSEAELAYDREERQRVYSLLDQVLVSEVPVVYLLVLPFPSALSARVQGWKANPNAMLTWDIANWWLEK